MNSRARNISAVLTSQPRYSAGNLYYVRLKTRLGIFYKLGFTTMDSVQARLAFQTNGDDELVDEVLVFVHRENAYAEEQLLHEHFRDKAILLGDEQDMPLYQNGQSELYADDILELDFLSKDSSSADATRLNVALVRGRRFGNDESKIRASHAETLRMQQMAKDLGRRFSWVVRLYRATQEWNLSTRAREQREQVGWIQMQLKKERRHVLLNTVLRAAEIKKNPLVALRADIVKAIEALKRHRLETFEQIVDVNVFARNAVKALTLRLFMGSDFMAEALACNMEALCDAMEEDDSGHQLLLKPIEETYKRVIREIVRDGRIWSAEITFPGDPRYRVEPTDDGSAPFTLTDSFGPDSLREKFGADWTLPDEPSFHEGPGSVSFDIRVSNSVTGFAGALRVRARYTAERRIAVDFPNFGDLDEQAFYKTIDYETAAGFRDPNLPKMAHYNQSRRQFGLDEYEE